jgi:hypothetical protein
MQPYFGRRKRYLRRFLKGRLFGVEVVLHLALNKVGLALGGIPDGAALT